MPFIRPIIRPTHYAVYIHEIIMFSLLFIPISFCEKKSSVCKSATSASFGGGGSYLIYLRSTLGIY